MTPTRHEATPISAIMLLLLSHKRIFVPVFILIFGLSIAYFIVAPKKYRASVELVPVQRNGEATGLLSSFGGLGSLASLAGLEAGGVSLKEEALASLRSKEFLFRFIEDNDLLPTLFSEDWDDGASDWLADLKDGPPTLWDGYRKIRKSVLRIFDDEQTGLVTISVEWTDRNVAAVWANDLVRRLNLEIRQRDIAESERSLEFLRQELEKTRIVELERSIYKLVEVEINKIMIANVREEYAFRVVDQAVAPDADRHFFPKGIIIIPVGLLLALVFASFAVLAWRLLLSLRSRSE